jgi:streptomycin 6-kinase
MVVAFPTELSLLTPEWLTGALRESGELVEGRVVEAEVTPMAEGHGFLGSLARVRLHYDGESSGGPSSVVAKVATDDESAREMAGKFGLYAHEIRFYTEIAPADAVELAACYFADIDEESGAFLLLLEDLSDDRMGDQVVGADLADARAVLASLARFHARFWNAEARPELEWLQRSPELLVSVADDYVAALPAFEQAYGTSRPKAVAIAKQLGAIIHEVTGQELLPPLTITHGDLRLDNIFFSDDGQARIIDWQVIAVDRGGLDVARLMAESVPIDVRRAHEDELLRFYLEQLREHGVSDLSLRRLRSDYREGMVQQLVLSVIANSGIDFASERGDELIEAMLGRLEAALIDLRVPRLLRVGGWIFRVRRVGLGIVRVLRWPFARLRRP